MSEAVISGATTRGGYRDERDGWCLSVDRREANATDRTMERRAEWLMVACLVITVLLFSSRVVYRGLLREEELCDERDEWCLARD